MIVARQAAGVAEGALAGLFPNPAIGIPQAGGLAVFDDFLGAFSKTTAISEQNWQVTDVAGGVSVGVVVPSASTEIGLLRLYTAGANGDGGNLTMPNGPRGMPAGMMWCAKVRVADTTNLHAWSGFVDGAGIVPTIAGTDDFVGVRVINTGSTANWYGVCKDSSGESTVDLGVLGGTTWRTFGFIVGESSIQFYLIDASDYRRGPVWTATGSAVGSHIPTGTMLPCGLGVRADSAATKQAEVDYWAIGGRVAR
jgi:hypothetical protein